MSESEAQELRRQLAEMDERLRALEAGRPAPRPRPTVRREVRVSEIDRRRALQKAREIGCVVHEDRLR